MGTAENKDIMRRIYEDAINRHDLEALDHYILADYVNHKNPGGLEGVKQLFSTLLEAFPDLRFSVDSIGADGDRVWARTTMRGTQQAPFMGMSPTGKAITVATVNEGRFENGKLAEEWGVTDTLAMWQQLGLMPASG
jgi:predicted ester cyclase